MPVHVYECTFAEKDILIDELRAGSSAKSKERAMGKNQTTKTSKRPSSQPDLIDTGAYDYVDTDAPWHDNVKGNYAGTSKYSGKTYRACYEDHPPLIFADGTKIFGGSCINPVVKDADVYIGLDTGMKQSNRSLPWEPGDEVYYPIQDMQVPVNLTSFTKMVDWTYAQLQAGKKVHAGCVGGHGRTGLLFAALAGRCYKVDDPIAFVRANYCKKAVETVEQVAFLVKNFGGKAAAATKTTQTYSKGTTNSAGWPAGKNSSNKGPTESGLALASVNPILSTKTYVFGAKAWPTTIPK